MATALPVDESSANIYPYSPADSVELTGADMTLHSQQSGEYRATTESRNSENKSDEARACAAHGKQAKNYTDGDMQLE